MALSERPRGDITNVMSRSVGSELGATKSYRDKQFGWLDSIDKVLKSVDPDGIVSERGKVLIERQRTQRKARQAAY